MSTIKVLVCRVGQQPAVEEIENTLKSWQQLVGGYIDVVHLDGGVLAVVNDEGRFTEPFNRLVPGRAPKIPEGMAVFRGDDYPVPDPGEFGVHEVYGNFALVRDDRRGDFCGLVDRDVVMWLPTLMLRTSDTEGTVSGDDTRQSD